MPLQIWKKIPGHDSYEVSATGLIRKGDKLLKPFHNKGSSDPYMRIKLTDHGIRKAYYVHQLVAMTYIPNPYNLPEVNHLDHNPMNNSRTNLEWCSHKDNCADVARFRRELMWTLIDNLELEFS